MPAKPTVIPATGDYNGHFAMMAGQARAMPETGHTAALGTRVRSAAGDVLAHAAASVVIRRAVGVDRDGIVRLAEVADAGDRLGTLLTDPCRCILIGV